MVKGFRLDHSEKTGFDALLMPFFIDDQADILNRYFQQEETHPEMLKYLAESLENFVSKDLAPTAAEYDEKEYFSERNFQKLGELGYFGIAYPEKYGGMGLNPVYHLAGLESLSKGDAGFTLGVAIHGTTADGLYRFASEEIKERTLPGLLSGKAIGCFGLSESDSGSDANAMRTNYKVDGSDYILNGSKFWITNAPSADFFFVMARNKDNPKQISSFLVEKPKEDTFKINPIKGKMGVRGSNTGELVFENHRIPKKNLIGEEGLGFKYAMHMLNGGRVTICAWSVGVAQAAYEKFLKYAHERKLFGKHLKDLDNTSREISEMIIQIKGARELGYSAMYEKSINHPNFPRNAAIAKVAGTEAAFHVAERAIELSGGYGYLQESLMERPLRDAILGRMGEGANELLKVVVIPRFIYKAFEKAPPPPTW